MQSKDMHVSELDVAPIGTNLAQVGRDEKFLKEDISFLCKHESIYTEVKANPLLATFCGHSR